MTKAALYATGVVILNVIANLLHASSHLGQYVMPLPAWQLAYVTLIIFVAPIAAAVLLWTRYRGIGTWLLLASMVSSFAFGIGYHFLVPGPDNVFTLERGAWRTAFWVSAVLLLLLEGTGCLIAVRTLSQLERFPGTVGRRRPDGRLTGSWPGSGAGPR
jgi:hypothetical protein